MPSEPGETRQQGQNRVSQRPEIPRAHAIDAASGTRGEPVVVLAILPVAEQRAVRGEDETTTPPGCEHLQIVVFRYMELEDTTACVNEPSPQEFVLGVVHLNPR